MGEYQTPAALGTSRRMLSAARSYTNAPDPLAQLPGHPVKRNPRLFGSADSVDGSLRWRGSAGRRTATAPPSAGTIESPPVPSTKTIRPSSSQTPIT